MWVLPRLLLRDVLYPQVTQEVLLEAVQSKCWS